MVTDVCVCGGILNLSTGGASRVESGHPAEAFHQTRPTMLALFGGFHFHYWDVLLVVLLFCSLLFCFVFHFYFVPTFSFIVHH